MYSLSQYLSRGLSQCKNGVFCTITHFNFHSHFPSDKILYAIPDKGHFLPTFIINIILISFYINILNWYRAICFRWILDKSGFDSIQFKTLKPCLPWSLLHHLSQFNHGIIYSWNRKSWSRNGARKEGFLRGLNYTINYSR